MTIHNKDAFEDAQLMARIAVCNCDSSFWFAAMQALKAAYKIQPVVITISDVATNIAMKRVVRAVSANVSEFIEAPKAGNNHV